MIPRDTIDRIFSAARIEDVVGDYISLKKRGANLIGLCPFHDEKTGSFTVSPSKGIYKCFGCGKAGNVVGFVTEIEQCSYVEALRLLAKKYHIEIEERELTQEEQQLQDDRESMFIVNDFANQWFQEQLWQTSEGQAIGLSYLRNRGLQDHIIKKFQIGYSPDKSLLSKIAVEKGFAEKYLLNDAEQAPYIGTGVCGKSEKGLYDRFHSRVIFPFFSQSGKIVGFAGRLLKASDKTGKYVNSPTSLLFEKHNELFGLFQAKQAISRLQHCYLVEGQMDVISMHQAGIENVVASGGTSLTTPQIKLLHRFTSSITVLYDGDKAGIKAAIRGIDMILEEGVNVKVVLLPEGEDPDSFAKSHNASDFIEYIHAHQTDFIRFKIQLLQEEAANDPIKRSDLIRSVVQSISVIPDAITRQIYIKDSASLLAIAEALLARETDRMRNNRAQKHVPASGDNTPAAPSATPSLAIQEQTSGTDTGTSSANATTLENNLRNLIRLIVRFGEKTLYVTENNKRILVGQHIITEIQNDNIPIANPVHQRIIDEYLAHYQDPAFVAETFFIRHPDYEISQLAVTLIANPYQLSRIFSQKYISENVSQTITPPSEFDSLQDLCQRLLLELKLTSVNIRIAAMQEALEQAQRNNDWNTIRTVLTDRPQLMNVRAEICHALGNRVITL